MNSQLASLCTSTCNCLPHDLGSIFCSPVAAHTLAAQYQTVYHKFVSFWKRCATLSLFGQYTNCRRSGSHVGTGWHSWACCLWIDLSRVHSTSFQRQYSENQPSWEHSPLRYRCASIYGLWNLRPALNPVLFGNTGRLLINHGVVCVVILRMAGMGNIDRVLCPGTNFWSEWRSNLVVSSRMLLYQHTYRQFSKG